MVSPASERIVPVAVSSGFDSAKLYVWVKGLESKVNNLTREFDLLKNELIKKNSQMLKDLKTTSDDLVEAKHQQEKMQQKMDLIIKELQQTAGKEELAVLKKYMEYWNPLNFVTQSDLNKAVESKISLLAKNESKTAVGKTESNKKNEMN